MAAFMIGGFSETYASLQVAGLAAGIVFLWSYPARERHTNAMRLLGASLFGAILALVAIAAAPGNSVRQSLFPAPPDLWTLAERVVADVRIFLYQVAKYHTARLALALLLPAGIGLASSTSRPSQISQHRASWARSLLGIPLLVSMLVAVPFAPSEYALSSYPDGRVLMTPLYVLFLGMAFWAKAVGTIVESLLRHPRARLAIARILLVSAIGLSAREVHLTVSRVADQLPVYSEFASAWDARDTVLRTAAEDPGEVVAVRSLTHMGGLAEIGPDPSEWINVCVADAYDVAAVVAK